MTQPNQRKNTNQPTEDIKITTNSNAYSEHNLGNKKTHSLNDINEFTLRHANIKRKT